MICAWMHTVNLNADNGPEKTTVCYLSVCYLFVCFCFFFTCVQDPNGRDWSEHQLSASQVKRYWDEGYLSNVPVLTEEQCDRLLEAYETFLVSVSQVHVHMYMERRCSVRLSCVCT